MKTNESACSGHADQRRPALHALRLHAADAGQWRGRCRAIWAADRHPLFVGLQKMRRHVNNKDNWKWTIMIMQPEIVKARLVHEAIEQVGKKKDFTALPKIRFEAFTEGKAAQIMHIGPFSEEGPTIQKVHDFIAEMKFKLSGKHHEIYLSDIRKAAPEKWKTIIRQPMKV